MESAMKWKSVYGWAIAFLIILVLMIALAWTNWYKNMTPSSKTAYWAVTGVILVVIAIIILFKVIGAPKYSEVTKIKY